MLSFKVRLAVAIGGLALALIALAPPAAQGDDWNLKTIFSVSQPFAVPGKVLEPNTKYVLRLLDLSSTRNVVQIFNEDQSELITTFMAASDYRLDPADTTLFEFIETDAGYPKPIRSWFYPGRLNGLEFLYPKDQAMDIVRHTREGVLTAEGTVDFHDLDTFEVAALDPDDVIATTTTQTATTDFDTDVEQTEIDTDMDVTREKPAVIEPAETEPAVIEPVVEEPEIAEPAIVQDDTDMDVEESAVEEEMPEETLPATAGELPLIGLIGALSLGIGLGLRALVARS
jgi:hypothetical protein